MQTVLHLTYKGKRLTKYYEDMQGLYFGGKRIKTNSYVLVRDKRENCVDEESCVQQKTYVACIDAVRRVEFEGGEKAEWARPLVLKKIGEDPKTRCPLLLMSTSTWIPLYKKKQVKLERLVQVVPHLKKKDLYIWNIWIRNEIQGLNKS